MTKKEEQVKITATYTQGGARAIFVEGVIALLYERGYNKLAKELTIRTNESFDRIDMLKKAFIIKNED